MKSRNGKTAEIPAYRGPVERATPDPEYGLNEEQVKARFENGWYNAPVDPGTRTVRQIIRSNTFTYFNMIFVILAVLLAVVRSYRDMLFMGVIICNTLIGIIQEVRSKKVLDELNIMNAVQAKVIRDGKRWEVLTEDLVIDDIIELGAGSQIPADAVVLSGQVLVNEALLTGESDEITKREGAELMSGSFVVSGSCLARLTAVGADSYISRLTLKATSQKGGEQSEMIRALDRLVKIIGVIIIPIGGMLFYQQYFVLQSSFRDSITNMVAAVIGMIPEGLYLTASIALAVSAMRLAMQKVLIHDMKCIETLARVTVMCVDKTGTITENRMEVKDFLMGIRPSAGTEDSFGGVEGSEGEILPEIQPSIELEDSHSGSIMRMLRAGQQQIEMIAGAGNKADETTGESGADLSVGAGEPGEDFEDAESAFSGEAGGESEESTGSADTAVLQPVSGAAARRQREILADFVHAMDADNSTMRALQEYFPVCGEHEVDQVISFSSRTKYSAARVDGRFYVLGAPEFLLGDDYELYQDAIESMGESGYRVLAFGSYAGDPGGRPLEKPVKLLGTVLLANRVRAGAVDTFRYFADRDVEVKVISGDNPVSVAAIAGEAGIAGADDYVDATTLVTDEDIADAVSRYTVFGRVTPDQKRKFVKALQKSGETVAMTGDGVNDVLALKDADCSIAIAGGSEAASQVAQLVLLDGDFSKMPHVVLEGRRVVNNIERTASLFLVKNIFSLLMAVYSVMFLMDYPLEAAQLSLISMFTIGIPAFILSQEPNRDPIRGRFLTNVLLRALPAGLTDFTIVLCLVKFCTEFGVDNDSMSTACALLVSLVGFMIMYRIMRPMTKFHWVILITMITGLVLSLFYMRWYFGIKTITRQVAMLMIVFGVVAEPMMRYLGTLGDWLLRKANPNPPRKTPGEAGPEAEKPKRGRGKAENIPAETAEKNKTETPEAEAAGTKRTGLFRKKRGKKENAPAGTAAEKSKSDSAAVKKPASAIREKPAEKSGSVFAWKAEEKPGTAAAAKAAEKAESLSVEKASEKLGLSPAGKAEEKPGTAAAVKAAEKAESLSVERASEESGSSFIGKSVEKPETAPAAKVAEKAESGSGEKTVEKSGSSYTGNSVKDLETAPAAKTAEKPRSVSGEKLPENIESAVPVKSEAAAEKVPESAGASPALNSPERRDPAPSEKKPENTESTAVAEKKPENTESTAPSEKKPENTESTAPEEKKPENTESAAPAEEWPEKTNSAESAKPGAEPYRKLPEKLDRFFAGKVLKKKETTEEKPKKIRFFRRKKQ